MGRLRASRPDIRRIEKVISMDKEDGTRRHIGTLKRRTYQNVISSRPSKPQNLVSPSKLQFFETTKVVSVGKYIEGGGG